MHIAHRRSMTRDFRISLIQTIRPKRCELLMHDTDRSPHPASSTGYGRDVLPFISVHLLASRSLYRNFPYCLLSFFSVLCLTLKHRHRTQLLHLCFKHMLHSIIKDYLVLKKSIYILDVYKYIIIFNMIFYNTKILMNIFLKKCKYM